MRYFQLSFSRNDLEAGIQSDGCTRGLHFGNLCIEMCGQLKIQSMCMCVEQVSTCIVTVCTE